MNSEALSSANGATSMQMGMIGLGRMGGNMVRRLMRAGHECVVYDTNAGAVAAVGNEGARGVTSLDAFAAAIAPPRIAWLMVPAAHVEEMVTELARRFEAGDVIVDGGNSHYVDAIRRSKTLAASGIQFIDVGTSGGVWGLERGFSLMVGGDAQAVRRLEPLFAALAPGLDSAPRTPGRPGGESSTAERGYLHCGPSGAGHFVKMVHNGIEYGLMA